MGDIINLNRERKKLRAAEKEKLAQKNRAKFGRTKGEKENDASARKTADAKIDAHKIENSDEPA